MALNKRKVLDAAQKYLQKGNLDRALKEYSKVLESDPRDTNVRLKVGDVQLRRGKSEEAIEAYFEVAKLFMKDGFDAKAVALFKQITKIDEKRYDIYEPLAELYQRLGLVSDAMGALQTAAEAHQREGRKKEGLVLLRKMASLDPSNTSTRLKIAQLLWKEDLPDESLEEYDEVVAELGRQDDADGIVRVHEQVLRELPGRLENLVGLGVAQLDANRPEAAEPPLLKATEVAVDSVEAWEALARVHEAMGRQKELEDTWKTVAAIYKDRGDEDRAKEILQLYVTPEALDSNADGEVRPEKPVADIDGGETLDGLAGETDDGLSSDELELDIGDEAVSEEAPAAEAPAEEDAPELDLDDEIEIELDDEMPGGDAPDAPAPSAAAEGEAADADPSQLLAEAGVYVRYSQHEKALGCLDQILAIKPNHLEALEKYAETQQALGRDGEAAASFQRAASAALEAGDREGFDRLCDRLREVDEAAAEALAADALTPDHIDEEPAPDLDVDVDLEFETPSGEPELSGVAGEAGLDVEVEALLSESQVDLPPVEAPGDDESFEAELEVGDESAPEEAAADSSKASAKARDGAATPKDDEAGPVESVSDDPATGASEEPEIGKPRTGGVTLGGSTTGGTVSAEDLEEAEFYYRQGLFDEAEQLLRRLLEVAPGHPQVLLRLGEIAKSRGECPSSPVGEGVDFDRTEEETNPGLDATGGEGEVDDAFVPEEAMAPGEDTLSAGATLEDLDGLPDLEGPAAGPDDVTLQADLADALPELDEGAVDDPDAATLSDATERSSLDDTDAVTLGGESGGVSLSDITGVTEPAVADAEPVEPEAEEAAPEASEAVPEPAPAPARLDAEGADQGFDLAAELSEVFDDSQPGIDGEATLGGTTQAGFESIFQSFKQGVKETLGEGEEETHFDLGIAYREMGLLEDAIGEFHTAMNAPARLLDCLAMMGLCALDLGRAEDAVSHLEQALAMPDLDEERMAGLRFDLGRAFEAKGDLDRARAVWQQVVDFDPDFQGVSKRLEQLGQGESSPSLGALDPDDLMGGEALESFDDLIAEAESDFAGDDDPDDDGDDGPPEAGGDDSEGDMGSTQWGRKVSYG